MPKIIVSVAKDGSTKIDFDGYEGPSCLVADDKLRELLSSLGIQVAETSFVAKPELDQEHIRQHVQQKEGEA
jgi:hypothetical protein